MNLIMLMVDTLRYDYLACNGNPWIKTPNFDRFSRQAACFDRAYCGSWPTVPQRTDAFTGCYGKPIHPWAPLSWKQYTLPEAMRNAGYVTMLIHDTPHLINHGMGFERPFHAWEMVRGGEVDRFRTDPIGSQQLKCDLSDIRSADTLGAQAIRNELDVHLEEDHCTPRLFRTAANWLERNRKHEKFFLWIDCFYPHEPWDPPQHYVDLYDPGYTGPKITFANYGSCAHLPPDVVKNTRALYAGLITLVDRWFGFLVDTVQLLGLEDDTIIIVNADHGTSACDRNLIGKAAPFYEEIGRVPLMIHLPGMNSQMRIKNLVQPVDLMPTILDLLEVAIPTEYKMDGISLLPLLKGKNLHTRDVAVTTQASMLYEPGIEHVTLTSQRWVLFDYPNPQKRQLFDLENDPGQTKNILNDHPNVADDLHTAFIEFLKRQETPPILLDIWSGKPTPTGNLEELVWKDPEYLDYCQGMRRGVGLTAQSYVRVKEFGHNA